MDISLGKKTEHPPGKAYVYTRVSTNKQADKGHSLDNQLEVCEQYVTQQLVPAGYYYAAQHCHYSDAGESGNVPFNRRTAGKVLDSRLRPGDAIVFARLDRGFRNIEDIILTTQGWGKRGVRFIALDLQVDTSTIMGEYMLLTFGLMAHVQRRMLAERRQEIVERLKGKGVFGQVRPFPRFGNRFVMIQGTRHELPDELQRRIIRFAMGLREQGFSWNRVYETLRDAKLKTWDGRAWSPSAICRAIDVAKAEDWGHPPIRTLEDVYEEDD